MSYSSHTKALLHLGVPLIGGHLAQFAVGMTDTLMLGWYSVDALAAVVLASTLFFVLFILGSGFAIAVMPMVAEADAQNDEVGLRRITRMGLWLSVIFGVLVLPLFWFSGSLLTSVGQDPELSAVAQSYLRVAGFGIIPALLVMVLKSYLAALEHTRVVLAVTIVATVANAFLNYALVFGNWGAPELGVQGAAIASVSVQVISIIGVVIYAIYALPAHRLFIRLWKPDRDVMKAVFRIGVPIGLTSLAEAGLFAASSVMMGWLGTIPLAAHGIAISLSGATFMIHLGLSNAATVRVGNAMGRRDADHMARGARIAIAISVLVSVAMVILFLSIPEVLVGVFVDADDPNRQAIIAIGVALLLVSALFQFVDGAQAMALGLLRGVMDTRAPMIIAAFSYWGIGLPCGYIFGFTLGWGGVGVWLGLVVGLSSAAVLLMWRFWGPKLRSLRRDFA